MSKIQLPIPEKKTNVDVYLPNKKVPFMNIPIARNYYGIVDRNNLEVTIGKLYFRLKVLSSCFTAKERYIVVEILESKII